LPPMPRFRGKPVALAFQLRARHSGPASRRQPAELTHKHCCKAVPLLSSVTKSSADRHRRRPHAAFSFGPAASQARKNPCRSAARGARTSSRKRWPSANDGDGRLGWPEQGQLIVLCQPPAGVSFQPSEGAGVGGAGQGARMGFAEALSLPKRSSGEPPERGRQAATALLVSSS